ncbi:hypothetical protein AALP_AA5G026600 [Arabis alpina]|uniref:Uncharacterized protein n=1 Tax=Arabis alpina TaxID=50452 RepID=A0A087GUI6_ARAAL|nr:hypothetical protein AALP_AA5G026600 [Arabis alpina]
MVILLSSLLLHLFLISSRVGAIRVLSETPTTTTTSPAQANNKQEDLMKKYFGAVKFPPVDSLVGKGVSDSKRRVPSCPDPLHN